MPLKRTVVVSREMFESSRKPAKKLAAQKTRNDFKKRASPCHETVFDTDLQVVAFLKRLSFCFQYFGCQRQKGGLFPCILSSHLRYGGLSSLS
jgi:hypothetical protein